MKDRYTVLCLLAIFLCSLAVNLMRLQHVQGRMDSSDYTALSDCVVRAHGIFISVITGGLFARGVKTRKIPAVLAIAAISLCAAWALYFFSAWSGFSIPGFNADELLKRFNTRSTEAAFLTAAALSYLFGATEKENEEDARTNANRGRV